MRILTWNINGIRTIPQYHPWNTFKTHDGILNHLEADIINFQEVKSTRTTLPSPVAAPPSYDAYYSFPLTKNGYSGVATYTRRPSTSTPGVTALKAEEGLTGKLHQPHLKPPISDEERVSRPEAYDYDEPDSVDINSLDAEGRVLTLDFGFFVLINVYCPNDGSSEEDTSRFHYKMAFHRLLEARVRTLIREGRQVILLGDINACASIIDHCEGDLIVRRGASQGFSGDGQEYFWVENDARRWLRDLLEGEKKCLVDVVRKFHPERRGMFTCWNTKLSARASNYGSRIDYILVTPGLLPWIKAADIEPSIKGSDHCPVWIDLHEEINLPGEDMITKLRDAMSHPTPGQTKGKDRDPPRLATRHWDEHSGKQRSLASFFNVGSVGDKIKPKKLAADTMLMSVSNNPETTNSATPGKGLSVSSIASTSDTTISLPVAPLSLVSSILSQSASSSDVPDITSTSDLSNKRKAPPSISSSVSVVPSSPSPKIKKQKTEKNLKHGQSKLSSFFLAPSTQNDSRAEALTKSKKRTRSGNDLPETGADAIVDLTSDKDDEPFLSQKIWEVDEGENDEDLRRAIQLSLSQSTSSSSSSSPSPLSNLASASQEAWKSILKPPEPPKCSVHNEVAKEFRVNKPGINKGRSFWVCSRPVGPGYDKGRSERPREEVDPMWKCNFFVWSSDLAVKRTTSKSGKL
ncbi:Endonuclease/exonuclease/phosphatase [Lentinula aciculospora]|uniref:DNA-(apurinic or apyrimidinic site) endonuclease n=1 Tax=Lentinula aciculospora TaxID=153920 RepID=A0A9W9DZ08_9AGAR|nr:Endonuclease/exonuclease/phosphatase [Lentinula aciculospora]